MRFGGEEAWLLLGRSDRDGQGGGDGAFDLSGVFEFPLDGGGDRVLAAGGVRYGADLQRVQVTASDIPEDLTLESVDFGGFALER